MLLSFLKTPRKVPQTGDDSPATSVMRYVWRMSGWHQVTACLVAVVVTLLNLVPLELQRRIVNEIVETQDVPLLVRFGILYALVTLLHQLVKFGLRIYQGWLTESATRYTRSHLLGLYSRHADGSQDDSGRAVAIVGSEVEKLGGFVGSELSQACANVAMLVGVGAYMLVVEPKIAAFALIVLIPQVLLTPVIQRHLNNLVEERVGFLRELGDEISEMESCNVENAEAYVPKVYENQMMFLLLKFAMKSVLNILNSLGPMTVLLFGGYLVMQGETQIGVIVAFLSGFDRLASPVRELISFYRVAAQANVQHKLVADWISSR